MSLNKVLLIGRLGKDPEVRHTQGGQTVANFSLATDEGYIRDGGKVERTEWHKVVTWSKQAEFCANYLRKGSLVFVEGSLQTREWQDQQGQTKYTTEIRAQRIQSLEKKGGQAEAGTARESAPTAEDETGPYFPSESSSMDDLPF